MQGLEQYFTAVLFIMLYKVVQTFKYDFVDEILKCYQLFKIMTATDQYKGGTNF